MALILKKARFENDTITLRPSSINKYWKHGWKASPSLPNCPPKKRNHQPHQRVVNRWRDLEVVPIPVSPNGKIKKNERNWQILDWASLQWWHWQPGVCLRDARWNQRRPKKKTNQKQNQIGSKRHRCQYNEGINMYNMLAMVVRFWVWNACPCAFLFQYIAVDYSFMVSVSPRRLRRSYGFTSVIGGLLFVF